MKKLKKEIKKLSKNSKIGFIGTGWIGSNYADNLEDRGFNVVRYSLDKKYVKNKEKIKECDVVFIAVNTPTVPKIGFDGSIVKKVIKENTVDGQIIVIKSTVKVGFTIELQEIFKDRIILNCPEFLTESTARHDVDFPDRNIIGETKTSSGYGSELLKILPKAKKNFIVDSNTSELVKYMGNCYLFAKNMMTNIFYQLSIAYKIKYSRCAEIVSADPRIGECHSYPIHKKGRGAGGDCLPKDMNVLHEMLVKAASRDPKNKNFLFSMIDVVGNMEILNLMLLMKSNKDQDIVESIFGKENMERIKLLLE